MYIHQTGARSPGEGNVEALRRFFTILTVAKILGAVFFWRDGLDNRNGRKGLHQARIMAPLREAG
jgi:hypothetical protein